MFVFVLCCAFALAIRHAGNATPESGGMPFSVVLHNLCCAQTAPEGLLRLHGLSFDDGHDDTHVGEISLSVGLERGGVLTTCVHGRIHVMMSMVGRRVAGWISVCPPPTDVQVAFPSRKMAPFGCFPLPPPYPECLNAVIVRLNISRP